MATKRQQTMAKMNRERAVREKRARKQEKKEERKAQAALGLEETSDDAPHVDDSEHAQPEDLH
jgi:hypothetical protein